MFSGSTVFKQTFPAQITKMRFFIGVVTFVNCQISGTRKSFFTKTAFVRLNAHVTSHVNDQVIVSNEAKAALWKASTFIYAISQIIIQSSPEHKYGFSF